MGLRERFQSKTVPEPNTGCLLWEGATDMSGYGKMRVRGSTVGAHRIAWELQHGPIPAGLWVLHRCDTRLCVNPDHLFLGTREDNIADMVAKGRSRNASDRWRGEIHNWAKLTWEQVKAIRARYAAGGVSQYALAREFGVSQGHVSALINGRRFISA